MHRAILRALLRRPVSRRSLAILSGAVLAAAGQLVLAPVAGASARPAVEVAQPDIAGTSAALAFTVNRAAHAIGEASCSLTDASEVVTDVSCGTPVAGPERRSTAYRTTLTDLSPGDYAYAVTITLTDGGTATGSRRFTVEQPAPVEFAASAASCQALGGSTFVAHAYWWQVWSCDFDATTADAGAAASADLGPLCLADGGLGFSGGLVAPGRYEVSCWLT
jgi:hypothetical protein